MESLIRALESPPMFVRRAAVLLVIGAVLAAGPAGAAETDDEAALLEYANEPWTGDLDGILERGFIRILTSHNPLFFSYDGIRQRGFTVEVARAFEEHLNKAFAKDGRHINVILIPVPRDRLLPGLAEGRGDIAAANLTITPARQELVQFSEPTYPGVRELVVSGPAAPKIAALDDLATTEIHVRKSSSYFEHLTALNEARRQQGKPEFPLREADELLEDYDLLDMVNAGVIPVIIVDSHKAALWAQVFDNIEVHEDLAVHSGGSIAWALRKDNPKLLEAVNAFVKQGRKGTLLGNVLINRYLRSTKWMESVLSEEGRERYRETIGFIRRHAEAYDFDWLMIAAQGYQESKLDQTKRSSAGAVGIMQLLPTTAADPNVAIPDIDVAERNVEAGVKYLRFLRQRYFSDAQVAPLDQVLFSFAAYNAGPANIAKARNKAAAMGFDPDVWFGHVEVAAAKTISREPVVYVRNIYKYYVAYKQLSEVREARESVLEGQD